MAAQITRLPLVKRLLGGFPLPLLLAAIFFAVLIPLCFLSRTTYALSAEATPYGGLFFLNLLIGLILFVLVGINLLWLYRRLKRKVAGALLARKLILLFGGLALFPAVVVFAFALQFIDRSIDSWFDLQIDRALQSALELTKRVAALEGQRLRREVEAFREEIRKVVVERELLPLTLEEVRLQLGAKEMAVLTTRGEIVALSGDQALILPSLPDPQLLLRAKEEGGIVVLDPATEPLLSSAESLAVRVLLPLEGDNVLQVIRPLPTPLLRRALQVEEAYGQYQQMAYLRRALKLSFSLTLGLILLISLLTAFWAAFISTRRLVKPIQVLLEGTKAVAAGNFEKRLPVLSRDDMGQLIAAFNTMISQLEAAQKEQQRSQQQLEEQHAYLEAVLNTLYSGVITLSRHFRLEISNRAASEILGLGLATLRGEPLSFVGRLRPELKGWIQQLRSRLLNPEVQWHFELTVGGRVLLTRGGPLHNSRGERTGHVIVFDDITTLVQAQKRAAWSEMARRLAHEIKNPLTPIRLAAERLHHKLEAEVSPEGARLLERSTQTIIQQVETLKGLASAFSDFARPPKLKPERLSLKEFFENFTTLYPPASRVQWILKIPEDLPSIEADSAALQQLFHNLTKNALEAVEGEVSISVEISSTEEGVEIFFCDNGPGIPPVEKDRIFEPYVTTKTKGSGLGLAIVRRIVEEHGGKISLEESRRGACFKIELPRQPIMVSQDDRKETQGSGR